MKKTLLSLLLVAGVCFSCSKSEVFLPYDQQLKIDVAAIDKYLSDNGLVAVEDSSGLRYIINSTGTGQVPTATGTVYLHQTITTLSGSYVTTDSSGNAYAVAALTQGQQIALLKMPKGSTYTLYVPSGLAYGNSSADGLFGPNTNLIIRLTLLDDDAELALELSKIDSYLDTVGNVIKDPSGLRLVILAPGTSGRPTSTSTIAFDYTLTYLNGSSIGSATNVLAYMPNLIQAFQIGMPYIGAGGHVRLYVPSKLAYGYVGSDSRYPPVIPGKSMLIFDVKLNSF